MNIAAYGRNPKNHISLKDYLLASQISLTRKSSSSRIPQSPVYLRVWGHKK